MCVGRAQKQLYASLKVAGHWDGHFPKHWWYKDILSRLPAILGPFQRYRGCVGTCTYNLGFTRALSHILLLSGALRCYGEIAKHTGGTQAVLSLLPLILNVKLVRHILPVILTESPHPHSIGLWPRIAPMTHDASFFCGIAAEIAGSDLVSQKLIL